MLTLQLFVHTLYPRPSGQPCGLTLHLWMRIDDWHLRCVHWLNMAVLTSSLLVYVNCLQDRSTPDALWKMVFNSYSLTEISEDKKLIVSTFSSNLDGCQQRLTDALFCEASDAEVEDILASLLFQTRRQRLQELFFFISSGQTTTTIRLRGGQFLRCHRSSNRNGRCSLGPNGVGGRSLADRRLPTASVIDGATAAVDRREARVPELADGMNDQLN